MYFIIFYLTIYLFSQKISYNIQGTTATDSDFKVPNSSLVSLDAEELYSDFIPSSYKGTIYIQVVDTFYEEMREIVASLS